MYEKENKILILSGDFRCLFSAESECPFSFSARNGISYSSAFSFTAKNEECCSVGLQYTSQTGLGLEMQSLGLDLELYAWS